LPCPAITKRAIDEVEQAPLAGVCECGALGSPEDSPIATRATTEGTTAAPSEGGLAPWVIPVAVVAGLLVLIILVVVIAFCVALRWKKRDPVDPYGGMMMAPQSFGMTPHNANPGMTMSGIQSVPFSQTGTMQMGGYHTNATLGAGVGYADLSRTGNSSISYASTLSEPRLSAPISYDGSMPTNADLDFQSARYMSSRSPSFNAQDSRQPLSGDGYTSATTDPGLQHTPSNYANYRENKLPRGGEKAAF